MGGGRGDRGRVGGSRGGGIKGECGRRGEEEGGGEKSGGEGGTG